MNVTLTGNVGRGFDHKRAAALQGRRSAGTYSGFPGQDQNTALEVQISKTAGIRNKARRIISAPEHAGLSLCW